MHSSSVGSGGGPGQSRRTLSFLSSVTRILCLHLHGLTWLARHLHPATEKVGRGEGRRTSSLDGTPQSCACLFGALPFGQNLGTGSKLAQQRLGHVIFILGGHHVCSLKATHLLLEARKTGCKGQSAASILHTQWARCSVLGQEKQDAVHSSH